ncbi:MAG: TIM barrel protein [Desulfovibrio sp.]|jgi:hydroxypyruvate isomerase|nr:TIM barrel protein [Desulfovibrio sp.]
MPKFSANLSMLFSELPLLVRFAAAAKAGFAAVEFLFPYAFPPDAIRSKLEENNLALAMFNLYPGDFEKGERGFAVRADRRKEFRASVEQGVQYALKLGCKKLHAMSGLVPEGAGDVRDLWLGNMRMAADIFAGHDIVLLCEALNPRNNPGYFLLDQHEADLLVQKIDRPNARVQLDIYHAQITNGDLSFLIRKLSGRIGHVQIASVPDRHEPDEGEINYPHIFAELEAAQYHDWIGCEYVPRGGTAEGLGWLADFQA